MSDGEIESTSSAAVALFMHARHTVYKLDRCYLSTTEYYNTPLYWVRYTSLSSLLSFALFLPQLTLQRTDRPAQLCNLI